MPLLHYDHARIAALTCCVPDHVQHVNTDPAHPRAAYIKSFIRQIGIKQRHISVTEQTCVDTGFAAAQRALEHAGWDAQSLDGVIFLSQTPDFNPATSNAFLLHYRLGMRTDAMAFDLTLGCSSFPYGYSVCASLLQQPAVHRLLLVSGDTHWTEYPDAQTLLSDPYFIGGEGSVAVLIDDSATDESVISLHSDGSGYRFLFWPNEGCRNAWRRHPDNRTRFGVPPVHYMDGLEITSFATTTVVDTIRAFLADTGTTVETYDGIVLHQANKQIVQTIARRLHADQSRVPVSYDRYANTDGTSPLLTIADAYAGDHHQNLRLLCCAFGVGLSWGVLSFSINPSCILPIFTLQGGQFEEGCLYPPGHPLYPEFQADQGAMA